MGDWFIELTTLEKIFWIAAIASSVFFVIQMISTFALGDFDVQVAGDTDFDIDADDGIPYQFFTLRNMVAFFMVFSWVGLGLINGEMSTLSVVLISSASGLLMMVIMSTLFYFISRMTDSGTLNMANAVGKTCTVYIPVKNKRSNMGKVQITIQGSIHELDAMTDEEEDLKTGSIVKVLKVLDDNILIVEKSK